MAIQSLLSTQSDVIRGRQTIIIDLRPEGGVGGGTHHRNRTQEEVTPPATQDSI